MAQTNCPACGAPLGYSGTSDIVRCDFCNAELQVVREDDQLSFQVLSQPGPQKEVLSNPVEPAPGEPMFFGSESQPGGASVFDLPEERPVIPSSPTFSSAEPSFTPPVVPSEGSQVYPPVSSAQPSRSTRNWVLISVGIVAGICLLCLCMGIVLFLALSVFSTGTF